MTDEKLNEIRKECQEKGLINTWVAIELIKEIDRLKELLKRDE